ncbi:flavin-dependent oxidoreductase [Parafrigoribacterium mesophilum]|uniref:flavin-dependent oxidoreductase n=1 Tax=Parafrigoribacterium mesophilum TaxID=433646 RepID=UPI0031FCB3E1
MDVAIVGAGIGGLTLALELHDAGIPCRVYEAVPRLAPLGVGINVLPHASAQLGRLGLLDELAKLAVTTRESVFFNRFGQLIYAEPCGRYAGYATPQFSIHRGDLQKVLADAVLERLGPDAIALGHRITGFEQDDTGVNLAFESDAGELLPSVRASVLIACDGVHSVVRRHFYPDEGEPRYSGVNTWRGVTRWQPILSGASMVRAGWLSSGKMVIYPIRDSIDAQGRQLVNWLAEIETDREVTRDWNRRGDIGDFIHSFEDWHFDWLDVPAMIRAADTILEYPMVDQPPLDRWTFGRVTLLGDAAHPMVPRGSNGSAQAILDARELRHRLHALDDPAAALEAYQQVRLPATAKVVSANLEVPPDILLKVVLDRTGDQPFDRIEDVISQDEMQEISERYKRIAGFSKETLAAS